MFIVYRHFKLGRLGLGGQSLDQLSISDYPKAVGNVSSLPESLSSDSPKAGATIITTHNHVNELENKFWESKNGRVKVSYMMK